ncbi:unnamed protein product [Lathyrus sativus]|nr:unnamed protein product [Lathyrus sativus]CAK8079323.1 unnamed protein product [Lathyrus sativus]
MFMSMFSHFDISQGKQWSFSLGLGPVKDGNPKPNKEATSSSKATVKDDPKTLMPGGDKKNPTRLRTRFAPEFDGLNCFECIVPSA